VSADRYDIATMMTKLLSCGCRSIPSSQPLSIRRPNLGLDGPRLAPDGETRHATVLRVAGGTELRIVAMSPNPATAAMNGSFDSVTTVDLLGRHLDRVSAPGQLALTLTPWAIRSIVVA
jgi:alpha-mannosidase